MMFADKITNPVKETLNNTEHKEGPIARALEQQTAKLPSDTFLWAAIGSMGLSLGLQLLGEKRTSNFVGLWAPTFLLFGVYNKIVKTLGSDAAV
jgi:hypothetical protein